MDFFSWRKRNSEIEAEPRPFLRKNGHELLDSKEKNFYTLN